MDIVSSEEKILLNDKKMNPKTIKQTILVAFFVSIASQIHFDFLTEGFIIALSSVVMAIFIYCYVDLSAGYIAILSGIFSPAFRLIVDYAGTGELGHSILTVMPDMIFFFSYAAIYVLIYKFVIRGPKSMKNFPFVIFFCDMLSNDMELLVRSLLAGHNLLTPIVCAYLALIALLRTVIIMTVIIAIEAYGSFLINKEHDEEYKRLLTQASGIEGEMRIMSKNVTDVEGVMKKAYDLYYQAKDQSYPKELTDRLLEIAKETHEIKGDYQNVLGVLNNTFLGSLKEEHLSISEIVALEKGNVLAMARKNNYKVEITTRINVDFTVKETFKLMAVIRNLMTNACEAIGTSPGKITVTVSAVYKYPDAFRAEIEEYRISVRDNGPGISEEELENIFLEGYSTKFDPVTGNIERGLRLSLVKDYIENDFNGWIETRSEVGKYTEFVLIIPYEAM